jgi:hypothetical protein
MRFLGLDRLWEFLTSAEFFLGLLWVAMAGIAVALLVLVTTRWGQSRPLRKCLMLSVVVHLWLIAFLATVKIAGPVVQAGPPEVLVRLADGTAVEEADALGPSTKEKPREASARPWFLPPVQPKVAPPEPPAPPKPDRPSHDPSADPAAPKAPDSSPPATPKAPDSSPPAAPKAPDPLPSAPPQRQEPGAPSRGPAVAKPRLEPSATAVEVFSAQGRPDSQPTPPTDSFQAPDVYRLRTAPNRSQVAQRLGASPETEAAVKAALRWLAENQESDGRWSVAKHGGGRESYEAGRDRQGAGAKADAAITSLALLAFTANGNTHLEGPYRANVGNGIHFLLQVQRPDGNLAGQAEVYELMYCHGMATLALGEVCGMSGDQRLREPLRTAVAYIVAAQDPFGGGWRYRPKDPGDTSQLGWQLMALKSAELAGIRVPEATWQRAARFLESVSGGNHGGLASYRPGERFTRTMTAEALACREFLGLLPSSPTCREAADYLLGDLPGDSEPGNLYYWYYATMALYPVQGSHWRVWSGALHTTLVRTQRRDGVLAGSWDPTTRWDGYGGRVYSTAMAALCLQTYYRFFPVQAHWGVRLTSRGIPLELNEVPPCSCTPNRTGSRLPWGIVARWTPELLLDLYVARPWYGTR